MDEQNKKEEKKQEGKKHHRDASNFEDRQEIIELYRKSLFRRVIANPLDSRHANDIYIDDEISKKEDKSESYESLDSYDLISIKLAKIEKSLKIAVSLSRIAILFCIFMMLIVFLSLTF